MIKKIILASTIIIIGIIFSLTRLNNLLAYSKNDGNLSSPVNGTRQVLADNLWSPQESSPTVVNVSQLPEISAKAAFFVDGVTGQVLYSKNIHDHLPIASLTKIMTVIVTLEHKNLKDTFLVSQSAADMEPDKMLLRPGEWLSTQELLDGIFLVSANDAAELLAQQSLNSREQFIGEMNSKAKQLGMKDSLFINPTGLEEDPSVNSTSSLQAGSGQTAGYSSAYDVALMSRYAIKTFPFLLDISNKPHIYLEETSDHQDYDLYSGINLLTTYPGVIGFKTGFTPEAGLTLVTMAKKGNHLVIGVLLGSQDRRDEARELLDFSFKKLGVKS